MAKPKQSLPPAERELLRVLIGEDLKARVKALHKRGWSLAAISQGFDPPKQRSTIHSWTQTKAPPLNTPPLPNPSSHPPLSPLSSASSSASLSTLVTAENSSPTSTTPSSRPSASAQPQPQPQRSYREYDPEKPKLTPAMKDKIAKIAPLARRYRARANPNGMYSQANNQLTEIAQAQYDKGVSIRELAEAAGVTYRAMARRLGK